MRSLTARLNAGVVYACVFFAVVAGAIGIAGIIGVASATNAGNSVTRDELASATITAQFSQELDLVYSTGQAIVTTTDAARRAQLATTLYQQRVPATDTALAALQRTHASDDQAERDDIDELGAQWTTLRNLLPPAAATPSAGSDPLLSAQLDLNASEVNQRLAAVQLYRALGGGWNRSE